MSNVRIKVFISTPMSGIDENDIRETLDKAKTKIRPLLQDFLNTLGLTPDDVDFVDGLSINDSKGELDSIVGINELKYLSRDLYELAECALAISVRSKDGTILSRGCVMERTACMVYGIPLLYFDGKKLNDLLPHFYPQTRPILNYTYLCNGKVPTCTKTTCKYLHPDLVGACTHTTDLKYSKTLLETGKNPKNFEEFNPGYFMEVES